MFWRHKSVQESDAPKTAEDPPRVDLWSVLGPLSATSTQDRLLDPCQEEQEGGAENDEGDDDEDKGGRRCWSPT